MRHCLRKGLSLAKKTDIIHTTTYNAAIPAWIIGKISKKPVVITVHEIYAKLRYKIKWRKWIFYEYYEKIIFWFDFKVYIAVSIYTYNALRTIIWIDDNKITLIYNGVDKSIRDKSNLDLEKVKSLRAKYFWSNFWILFFWRADKTKWLQILLDALPCVIKKHQNVKLLLIISDKMETCSLISTNNIEVISSVQYWELPYFVVASNCVVLPSLVEWFGLAAAEVSSLNHPLVVPAVWAIPEIVSWQIIFIEPNKVWNIISAIDDIIKWNIPQIPEKNFSWGETIEKIIELYTLHWVLVEKT